MASFTDIVTGHATLAADINQLVDALNGTVGSQVVVKATGALNTPYVAHQPSAPGSDAATIASDVSGDTQPRISLYIRGSDHYGGILGGVGTSVTSHWYAQSSGWRTPESVTIDSALSVAGTATIGALVDNGNATISGNLTVGGTLNGGTPWTSATTPNIISGNGVPASLLVGQIYIQLT